MKAGAFAATVIVLILVGVLQCTTGQRESGTKWMSSQHKTKGRGGQKVRWLIIHGTAGGSSAEGVGKWFQDPRAKASTHYIVDRQGKIVQSVDESDTAWANGRVESGADSWWSKTGNPNRVTISIEMVKPSTDNKDTITTAQKNAAFKLAKNIIKRHPGIRKAKANSSGGITGHYSISPKSRARCPGPFPFNDLINYVKK